MDRAVSHLAPLNPYAALLLRMGSRKILVISDLHIGWEVALAEEGIHIPSQMPKLLDRLIQLVNSEKPDTVLFLGDVKHTIARIEVEEWRDVPDFFEKISEMVPKVQVILGNHDGNLEPLLPEVVEILPSKGVILGDIGLFHGHTWPSIEMLGCKTLVIGHVHPVIVFRDPVGFYITRQVWVKAPCDGSLLGRFVLRRHNLRLKKNPKEILKNQFNIDLKVSHLIIMPSFNDFLGGQAINRSTIIRERRFSEFIGPVLRSGSVKIEKSEVYLLDGTFLGSLSQLRGLN